MQRRPAHPFLIVSTPEGFLAPYPWADGLLPFSPPQFDAEGKMMSIPLLDYSRKILMNKALINGCRYARYAKLKQGTGALAVCAGNGELGACYEYSSTRGQIAINYANAQRIKSKSTLTAMDETVKVKANNRPVPWYETIIKSEIPGMDEKIKVYDGPVPGYEEEAVGDNFIEKEVTVEMHEVDRDLKFNVEEEKQEPSETVDEDQIEQKEEFEAADKKVSAEAVRL